MSPERLPGLLLVASLAAALARGLWRARRWRAGRPADVDLMRGLAALPKRYLVDVHAVVLRDPPGPREPRAGGGASARMHVLTAGGLVLATPLALLQGLTPLRGPWLAVGLLAALAMMAAGGALVAWRRWPARQAGRAVRSGFSLERAAGLRRLCAMRALRGCLSRFRGRTAVEPEDADSGSGLGGYPRHADRIGCDRRGRHAVGLHDLPRLRQRMPDDDRARRCGGRPATVPDAGARGHAGQGSTGAAGAARDRHGLRPQHREPARLGGRPEAAASGARRIVRRAAVAGRGGFRSARPAHAACSRSSAAAGRGRLRGAGRRRARLRRPRAPAR